MAENDERIREKKRRWDPAFDDVRRGFGVRDKVGKSETVGFGVVVHVLLVLLLVKLGG